MTRILIIGFTGGGDVGQYETQLGNVAISIPMMKLLKDYIPNAEISTTIQFTDSFCKSYGINRIPNPKKFLPYFNSLLWLMIAIIDLFRASLWRLFKNFLHINLQILIKGNKLERFAKSDIVLDFNGDVFPTNVSLRSCIPVLIHIAELMSIRELGIPIIEFASSPGPFDNWLRRDLSKIMFNNISIFTNREPISSELLKQIGIRKPIVNTACPACLLEPASKERVKEILAKENVNLDDRPLIGITICARNLILRHTQRLHKNFDSLSLFVPMLKYLLDELNANVILVPHVYDINPQTNTPTYTYDLANGTDYEISKKLFKIINGNRYGGKLSIIEGKYSAPEVKAIIGQCDLYISGRLHAGIAALSQGIPTVLLAYGHKHYGIARLFRQESMVYAEGDAEELKSLIKYAWSNKTEITEVLRERLPRVKKLAHLNFEIVKEIIDLKKEQRSCIPKEIYETWIKRSE